MILKALTFDIIGTVFDAYDGLAQGVGPLNAKYGLNVQGSSFASGSLAGYAAGVGRFMSAKAGRRRTPSCRTPRLGCCRSSSSAPRRPKRSRISSIFGARCRHGRMLRPGCRRCTNTTPWQCCPI